MAVSDHGKVDRVAFFFRDRFGFDFVCQIASFFGVCASLWNTFENRVCLFALFLDGSQACFDVSLFHLFANHDGTRDQLAARKVLPAFAARERRFSDIIKCRGFRREVTNTPLC